MIPINIINGDCLEVLKTFPANHFDSVVTDPPYGLSFMGKKWDHQVPAIEIWQEVLRVLKPGGHMLVACGTRTQHRMVVNIEDAGFEIRDVITWHYGSGFPKSLDVSKAIDKTLKAKRKVVGISKNGSGAQSSKLQNHGKGDTGIGYMDGSGKEFEITAPATEQAKHYNGYGTALKPATEFWTLCRKPLEGTVAQNVLKWGVGGLRINDCRVSLNGEEQPSGSAKRVFSANGFNTENKKYGDNTTTPENGRYPANVIFDEFAGDLLDEQSGTLKSGKPSGVKKSTNGYHGNIMVGEPVTGFGDQGGASRFFYCAKAGKSERNKGLQDFEAKESGVKNDSGRGFSESDPYKKVLNKNHHPTVKPVALMRYLVKLITPPGGECLDPFAGSCSTGIALVLEEMKGTLIEREAEYCDIGKARIAAWAVSPPFLKEGTEGVVVKQTSLDI